MTLWYEPVDDRHYDFLYELLKERPKNACISHKKMPTFEQHKRFVDSFPYKEWYVIRDGGDMVGSVYLTHKNEFGMFILKTFGGRGIARKTFDWMERRHKGDTLYSNVNPKNKRIKRLLESIGCKVIQETYVHKGRS